MLLTAMVAILGSEAESVEPALNPNQPKARMSVPTTVIGRLWPGRPMMVPSRRNLPTPGPSAGGAEVGPAAANLAATRSERERAGERGPPAGHVHDRRAGEVHVAVPEPGARTEGGQPPSAPYPVPVERVQEHRHEQAVDHEGGELPALGHGAGRDGGGSVHEDGGEEEHGEARRIVRHADQRELRGAKQTHRA